jgi:hypothetical protein
MIPPAGMAFSSEVSDSGTGAGIAPEDLDVGARIFCTTIVKFAVLVDATPLLTAVVRVVASVFSNALWMLAALPTPLAGAVAGTVMLYCTSTEPLDCNNRVFDWSRRTNVNTTDTQLEAVPTNSAMPFSMPWTTFRLLTNACGSFTSIVNPPESVITTPAIGPAVMVVPSVAVVPVRVRVVAVLVVIVFVTVIVVVVVIVAVVDVVTLEVEAVVDAEVVDEDMVDEEVLDTEDVVLVDTDVDEIVVVVAVDVISKHVGNEPLNAPDGKHV